jgi:hypothetical protein
MDLDDDRQLDREIYLGQECTFKRHAWPLPTALVQPLIAGGEFLKP